MTSSFNRLKLHLAKTLIVYSAAGKQKSAKVLWPSASKKDLIRSLPQNNLAGNCSPKSRCISKSAFKVKFGQDEYAEVKWEKQLKQLIQRKTNQAR